MWKWIETLLDRLFVVVGAFCFSQIPLFMQQYRMQLAGHVAELEFQVERMRQSGMQSGKTLEQLIQKFLGSSDVDFSAQGRLMEAMVERFHTLSRALFDLNVASVWTRPYAFISHFQYDIAEATWSSFEIGLTLTYEGLFYAFAGGVIGYLCFQCFRLNRFCSQAEGLGYKSLGQRPR